MFGVLRGAAVLSLLMFFAADAVIAASTNKVAINSPSVVAGQQGVVTISLSNDEPMTLLNFDLTFATSFCNSIVLDKSECVGNGDPSACCTEEGQGDCGPKLERLPDRVRLPLYTPDNGDCTASATPEPCCTGPGTGTCKELVGYSPVSPQEGGSRCPTEGKMSFIFLDGSFSGAPIVPKCTCLGDASKNGVVSAQDYAFVDAFLSSQASPDNGFGDASCNGGFVNAQDYAFVDAFLPGLCEPADVGGVVARWVFDVRSDATPGPVPITVIVNDATNGPVTLCETGGEIVPPDSCTADIGGVGGTITINSP